MKKRYLNIPYEVLFNNNFDAENKIILSEIITLSKLPNGCIKSDERFGELVNLKRTAVNGRMNGLVKDGYIANAASVGHKEYDEEGGGAIKDDDDIELF